LLTPTERLSAALHTIGWGPQTLANQWGANERTVRRWLSGQNEPSEPLLLWLEGLARYHAEHPAPPLRATPDEIAALMEVRRRRRG